MGRPLTPQSKLPPQQTTTSHKQVRQFLLHKVCDTNQDIASRIPRSLCPYPFLYLPMPHHGMHLRLSRLTTSTAAPSYVVFTFAGLHFLGIAPVGLGSGTLESSAEAARSRWTGQHIRHRACPLLPHKRHLTTGSPLRCQGVPDSCIFLNLFHL